ncbi:M50 family metallopeptidase [Rossellomorea aquimaris]|uniref:M50 family metallopeptidase n=1 Tax=Rossellomorea aquimaris TaxID=189382 RepID=UPI001CFD3073|nr:M50 family metallopeptidase [Rossellomorea aquimaris]
MPSISSPKSFTVIGLILVTIGVSIELLREDTILIVSIFFSGWLAICLHELGHVIVGKWNGFEFGYFTAGPIQIEKSMDGIQIKENKHWQFAGGVAMMLPPKTTNEELRSKWAATVAGGPAVSLVVASLSYALYEWLHSDFLLFSATMNCAIFMATIIPMKVHMKSDGYQLITLLKKNEKSFDLTEDLLIMRELLSKKPPLDWSREYLQKAQEKEVKKENIFYAQMIFYRELVSHGFEAPLEKINLYRNIPFTKKDKHILGFIIHLDQLSLFFSNEPDVTEMILLQKSLSKIEPVSYYRGKAIIAHLQHKEEKANEHLQFAKKEIAEKGTLYGYFQAEDILTNLVEEKMARSNAYCNAESL